MSSAGKKGLGKDGTRPICGTIYYADVPRFLLAKRGILNELLEMLN